MASTTLNKNNKLDQPTFVWEGINKNGVKIRVKTRRQMKTS